MPSRARIATAAPSYGQSGQRSNAQGALGAVDAAETDLATDVLAAPAVGHYAADQ